ncbi:hypothetical protein ACKGID_001162 [Salmonella enterica]
MNYRAEATPEGVNIMTRNDAGISEHVELISYECAVARLVVGEYDNNLDKGFAVHLAVAEGGNVGWFDYTAQHNLEMWRWLIAAAFIAEMKRENGTTIVTDLDGIGIAYLSRCVDAEGITDEGVRAWTSMTADMGATVGGNNA